MDVLVLLIGSNNIPNFVTAQYLLMPDRDDVEELPVPGKLFLVYSGDTEKFKESLVECLKVTCDKIVDVPLGSDERNHEAICRKLREKLEEHQKDVSSIHLNYTGGTKTMVLAAYEAVVNANVQKKCYSYVDPKNYKIVTTMKDINYPQNDDLRKIKPDIDTIFKLHCLDEDLKYKKEIDDSNTKYFSLIEKEQYINIFSSKDFQKDLEIFEKAAKLNEIPTYKDINEKRCKEYEYYSKILKTMINMSNNNSELSWSVKNIVEKKYNKQKYKDLYCKWYVESFKDLITKNNLNLIFDDSINYKSIKMEHGLYDFIKSEWIEQIVFSILKNIQKEESVIGLTDVLWDVTGKSEGRNFQIDVIALRSYQIFVFSCTSSDEPGPCKQKAFEANYRAVQIGGEHAKSVLVCLKDDDEKTDIRKDMMQFEAAHNFSMIGREAFKDEETLKKAIRNILLDQG